MPEGSTNDDSRNNEIWIRIDTAYKALLRVDELVRYTNFKASLLLAICGIIIAFYLDVVFGTSEVIENLNRSVVFDKLWLMISAVVGVVLSVVSSILTLQVIFPMTMKNFVVRDIVQEKTSLFHFMTLAHAQSSNESLLKCVNNFRSLPPEEILKDLVDQLTTNAVIAKKKFKIIGFSGSLLFMSLFSTIFFIIYGVIQIPL